MNHLREVREVLYNLKKEYGQPMSLHKSTSTNNLETGVKTTSRIAYPIRRGIVLPESYITNKIYALSYIAANKNFTYGGFFNRDMQAFVIDRADLPVEVKLEDYIVFNHRHFEIKKLQALEANAGYIVIGNEIDGVPTNEVHEVSVAQKFRFGQMTDPVLN